MYNVNGILMILIVYNVIEVFINVILLFGLNVIFCNEIIFILFEIILDILIWFLMVGIIFVRFGKFYM